MQIPEYQRKTQKVQALQITKENLDQILEWTHGIPVVEQNAVTREEKIGVIIPTMHGKIRGGEGDIVLLDEHGEWKVMPFRTFQEMYS